MFRCLNISSDICVLSVLMPCRLPSSGFSRHKLLVYNCLAWGLSLLLSLGLAALDLNLLHITDLLDLPDPHVGVDSCFVDPEYHGVYLHLPVLCLLLLNIAAYGATFLSLRRCCVNNLYLNFSGIIYEKC